jgi:IclR family acetate operon transcriptional repressor
MAFFLVKSNPTFRPAVKGRPPEVERVNSIEKTLAVLRALSMPDPPHRLADIAARAGLGKTSAHRILQVLIVNNYAQARGEGIYAPGPALHALGVFANAQLDLDATARPVLAKLQQVTGHTVHFAVRSGHAAVYVSKIEGDKPYQMASRIGMQIELHCTSIGKAVLAALPTDELDAILADDMPATGIDASSLRKEVDQVRRRGYAIDDEENEANVRCAGAPVYAGDGSVIGGISVSGLTFTFSLKQLQAAGPAVAAAADELSAVLGHRKNSA